MYFRAVLGVFKDFSIPIQILVLCRFFGANFDFMQADTNGYKNLVHFLASGHHFLIFVTYNQLKHNDLKIVHLNLSISRTWSDKFSDKLQAGLKRF